MLGQNDAIALMQSVFLSPASPAPSKPLAMSPDVHVVEISPECSALASLNEYSVLDRQSISPRQPSLQLFALDGEGSGAPEKVSTYCHVAVSPVLKQRVLVRHIDASKEHVLPISPVSSHFVKGHENAASSESSHLMKDADFMVSCASNAPVATAKDAEKEFFSDVCDSSGTIAEKGKRQLLALPRRSSFVRVAQKASSAIITSSPPAVKNSVAIPDYCTENDLLLLVKAVVGDCVVTNQSRSQSQSTNMTHSTESCNRNTTFAKSGNGSMISVTKMKESEKKSSQQQREGSMEPHLHSGRFQVSALRDATNFQPAQEQSPEPSVTYLPAKTLSFWCTKHHSTRVGTARRMLLLQIEPKQVTVSMQRPDGKSWKGPPDSPLKPRAEDAQSVRLCRGENVEIVSGVAAYCHPGIHRTKVSCPAHCLVVSQHGSTVMCVELFSEAELDACVKVLKTVC